MPITEDPGRNNREAQGHPCPALPGNHAPELPALAPTQATPLRVLLLEDQALDAELLIKRLAKAGHAFAWTWVRSEAQYREALQQHQDLILSDYRLPSFSGREALGILRERGLDTPFILISGSVTEQETIDAIRLGADDFLQKDQLGRLVAAIEGVLERRRLLEHAQRNEVRLLAFLENSPSLAFIKDTAGHYLHANQRFLLAYGLESAAVLGKTDREIFPPAQSTKIEQHHRRVLDSGEAMTFEEHTEHADGIHTSLVTLFPLRDAQGAVYAIGGIATDITDRHAAEKYQRATFEHAPIGIVHTSLDGRFIEANPRACAILGYTRDELLCRSILELTHPADRAQATAFRKQLLAGQANDATTREKRYLRRDQSLIWAAVTLALVRKPDGAPEYFVAMIQDVSSRYIAEQQFRTTFEQATVGIVHSSLDGHYLLANQRFCDMLGYSLGEILGMRTRDVVHPEDRELDRTFRDKLLSGEINSYSGEKRYLRKNGAPIWVNRTISLARDEDGKPQYLIRVAEDITSRKEAEVRLEQTFEQAAVGIVRTDLERIIISVNRKFCEMTGYAREDLLGTNLRQISHPEDRGKDAPLRQRLLAGEVDHLQAERRYIRRDGSLIWVRRTTSLARDIANNQSHYIFVVEDITARRLAEDSYRATFDMAPIGIMHTGFDRRILDVNPKLCEILGYTRDELLTMTTAELLTPEYLESDRPHYMQQMIKGELQAFHSQRPYVRKDGSLVWTERSISLVRDRAGQPLYFLRMVEDISERKRVEDALAQERQLLRTVVDAIPDRIYVKDTEGRFILQNASNLKVRGVKNHDDIVGKTAFDVLPPELAKRVHEEDQAIIRSGQPMIDREGRTHFAGAGQENGSTHWHLTSKVPLINAEGRVYGLVGVNRDITEQKHSAERIMRLNRFFSTISATNAAIVRARDRETLFASICHVVVREGGLGSACVRIHDPQTDELRVVAHDGTGRDYFSEMPVSALPGDPEGDGMGGRTFRENTLMVSNDMLNDPTLARWHQRAGRHGFGALATLPLSCNGKVIGIFSLQAKETGFFDCEVVKLLGEMAGDISFALANLDLQAQHQATLHALQASDEQFRQLASHIPQIFWITDARQQQTLYASPTYETVTGRPLRDLDANPRSWLEAIHDEDRQQVKNARKEKAPIGDYDIEYRLVHANGSVRWIHDRAFPVKNANGEVYRIAGIAEDITEAKLSREQLAHLAHFDSLTGLPNRVLFNDRLRQSIAQARRNSWILGVLFLDLDRFKLVNDTLGHATGDLLLKQVAARLSACLRPSDTIARLSGDEFAIILSELSSPQNASLVAQKILAALAEPFNLDGHEVFVTTSIGITIYPTDSHDIETLIRDADAAMYGAKSAGRNNYQYYTAAMNARAAEKLQLETQMRRALERREFVLHYQPKIDIPSGRIFGFEALLRWQSPEQGLVPPGEFIPMLEETGLIVPVGEWIAQAACAQVRAWQDAGIKPVPVAINLSARQLRQPGFSEVLKQALLTSRVEPELIQVEITESSLMDNPEEAIVVLQQLKALGILLAADDFGTGYSSLSYLKRFPLDALKIDRSFVRDITIDDDDAVIARTVITLAHSLGLKVVAEGVETEEQLAFLGENRCDEAQGYLFARPLPADACAALLAAGQPLHRARTPDADGRTPAVLIVDDDKDHLLLSRLLLQKDGHPVLTTTNSHDALEMLATQPVGIVISDQNMPEMNGVELLRRVKLMYPEIVRIMLSGVSDFNMATAAINEGEVHKFFVKGRDEELLRREIRLKIRQIPEKSRTFPNLPAARQEARY